MKPFTHIRYGSAIQVVESGTVLPFDSINLAKKASRKLQQAGAVLLAEPGNYAPKSASARRPKARWSRPNGAD